MIISRDIYIAIPDVFFFSAHTNFLCPVSFRYRQILLDVTPAGGIGGVFEGNHIKSDQYENTTRFVIASPTDVNNEYKMKILNQLLKLWKNPFEGSALEVYVP